MSDQEKKIKEYTKDDLTIVWEASKCIHAGECVKTLPQVYDPKGKPWVKPDNASVEELKDQIGKCPSGALSYYSSGEEGTKETNEIKIHARMNGSLLIEGNMVITKTDGTIERREGKASFCRCGHSQNMPFCDASHKREGFQG